MLDIIAVGLTRKAGTSASHQYGTSATIDAATEIGLLYNTLARMILPNSSSIVRAGDLSKENGVYTNEHRGHRTGGEFDIGLFWKDGKTSKD